jgi:ABC-type transporter Mla subunit MlaD
VLKQIGQTTKPEALRALAQALHALPAKLTEAQASQALDPVLKQIGQTTEPDALRALAQALHALPAKLTEAQASQALDPVLKQIGQTTHPRLLPALAEALQALAPKLTEAQAAQASKAAAASLAWAADDKEAAKWARALVTLSQRAADRDGMLVTAIAYPAAAGSATEVLLDAIRADHPDAPAKEAGTESALAWLVKIYPYVLRPPHCPEPLQPG